MHPHTYVSASGKAGAKVKDSVTAKGVNHSRQISPNVDKKKIKVSQFSLFPYFLCNQRTEHLRKNSIRRMTSGIENKRVFLSDILRLIGSIWMAQLFSVMSWTIYTCIANTGCAGRRITLALATRASGARLLPFVITKEATRRNPGQQYYSDLYSNTRDSLGNT